MNKQNHIVEPEELMAYLEGELPPEQALDTAAHLERCRECQKLAADLKEVSEMMAEWQVEERQLELQEQITAELDKQKQSNHFRMPVIRGWSGIKLPAGRQLRLVGGLAIAALIIIAISIPNLQRSRFAAEQSARMARGRMDEQVAASQATITRRSPAAPKPAPSTDVDRYASANKLQATDKSLGRYANFSKSETTDGMEAEESEQEEQQSNPPGINGPMIVRTADLGVVIKEFDQAHASLDEILKRHHGYIGELNANTPVGSARSLTGTLRVPSNQLDGTLADLKALGRVSNESQSGEEVTQQYVDLQARLANAKHTEQRLTDILRERTGKLSDVLAVEMQISRVRGEIEQMEAQRKTMKNQVEFATLTVTLTEEYKAELKAVPPSTSTQFRNAAVDGYRSLVDGIITFLLWLLSVGPSLLLWSAILFFPARYGWKKLRANWVKEVVS